MDSDANPDDVNRQLLARARAGDREALGELLENNRDYLRNLADRLLDDRMGRRIDASDVVQQTCLSVHKQIGEFVVAAMDISNDVEGAVLVLQVIPQRLPHNFRGIHFFGRLQDVDSPKAFTFELSKRIPQLPALLAHNMRTEIPFRAVSISLLAQFFREVKNDGDRNTVILARKRDDRLAGLRLHVRRINHHQPARRQPLGRDEMEHFKRVFCRRLAIFVIRHKAAAEVRGKNFCRSKMFSGKA